MNKAIILAGGKGTRLLPLTAGLPKPLMTVLGKSVIERALTQLEKAGITKVVISTMYLSEKIEEKLGESFGKIKISYFRESTPLGTSGAVPFSCEKLGCEKDENVLIVPGDGICDFDYSLAERFHTEKNADMTIMTSESSSPLEYGLVLSDRDGRIYGFNEKPSWSQVTTNHVNSGAYIMNTRILDMIPAGKSDFSNDIFPLMLKYGKELYEYNFPKEFYWCDIGNLKSYYKCCTDALCGRIGSIDPQENNAAEKYSENGIGVILPSFIEEGVHIEAPCSVGPFAVIESGARIGQGCDISGSIIHGGAAIFSHTSVDGAMICRDAVIKKGSSVSKGCVIAENVCVKEKSHVPENTILTFGEQDDGDKHCGDAFENAVHGIEYTQNGILLYDGQNKNTNGAVKLACALPSVCEKYAKFGVMYDGTLDTKIYSELVLCGIELSGSPSCMLGEGFESCAKYAAIRLFCDYVFYVYGKDGKIYLRIFDELGFYPSHSFERKLMTLDTDRIYGDIKNSVPKKSEKLDNIPLLYYGEIYKNAKHELSENGFSGMKVAFVCDEKKEYPEFSALIKAYTALGGSCVSAKEAHDLSLPEVHFSEKSGILVSQSNYTLDKYHMTAFFLERLPSSGIRSVYLPFISPAAYKAVKELEIIGYPLYSAEKYDLRKEAFSENMWLYDKIFLAAKMLCHLHREKCNISEIYAKIQPFSYKIRKYYPNGDKSKFTVINSIRTDGKSYFKDGYEGISLEYDGGRVTVIPCRENSFKIITEAASSEIADELYRRTTESFDGNK